MEDKNSDYYLGNIDNLPVMLIFKSSNGIISQELPWDTTAEPVIHAFYTAMIGLGFNEEGILEAMKEYAEEKLDNKKSLDNDYE